MRILALIPARGGSKRLPGKNIRLLGGKPLIVWSIDVVVGIPEICDILVSTDDPAIAAVCKDAGALVPWLRPAELATDTASSVDVALHALDWYEAKKGAVDGLLLLQPTSPFRTADTIQRAIDIFEKDRGQYPVVSVSPASCHPSWCFRSKGEGMEPFLGWASIERRSQELEPAWTLNGSIYLISPARLLLERTFLPPDTRPLVISSLRESIDIDLPSDFDLCDETLRHIQDKAV